VAGRLAHAVIGRAVALPQALLDRFPELREARWRVGGLPPRIGGWFLLRRTVGGITLRRTIWLARDSPYDAGLLLHELCHVRQFDRHRTFPLLYAWESIRRGYTHNRFEAEADAFARRILAERHGSPATPAEGP
jgi:hypothetical protein